MHYPIIVISKDLKSINTDIPYIILNTCYIIDNNSLLYNDLTYYFDYLIFDDPSSIVNLHIEKDKDFVITNYHLQTTIENFFAVGNCVKTSRSLSKMIDDIICYIKNPESEIF